MMPRTVTAIFYGIFVDLFSLAISADAWFHASTDLAIRTIKMIHNRNSQPSTRIKRGIVQYFKDPSQNLETRSNRNYGKTN
ncbi:hypothetical protein JCM5350_000839 [Sporobolomyces pararoseus]